MHPYPNATMLITLVNVDSGGGSVNLAIVSGPKSHVGAHSMPKLLLQGRNLLSNGLSPQATKAPRPPGITIPLGRSTVQPFYARRRPPSLRWSDLAPWRAPDRVGAAPPRFIGYSTWMPRTGSSRPTPCRLKHRDQNPAATNAAQPSLQMVGSPPWRGRGWCPD